MNAFKRTATAGVLRASQRTNRQTPLRNLLRRNYATDPLPPSPHPPSTPPNPNNPQKPPSRVTAFYKSFSYPILKCFLGALFTYQLAYTAWFKLQVVEEQATKKEEVEGLKAELKEAVVRQKDGIRGVVGKVEEEVQQVKGEAKKRGWWPS